MPYSTQVTLLDLSGAVPLPLAAQLWELWSIIDGRGRIRRQQNMTESTTVTGVASFSSGPSYLERNNHQIAIFVGAAGEPGPLFRSGAYDTLPPGAPADPNGHIEIYTPAQPLRFTAAGIDAMLPAVPMALGGGATITGITVRLGPGTLTVTATGMLSMFFGPVGFTYTLTFSIAPSIESFDVDKAFEIVPTGPGVLTPPALAFFGGLLGRTESKIRMDLIARLEALLDSAARNEAAAVLGVPALAPGVVVSVRRVVITPSGVAVFPAIGAYGGVLRAFLRDLVDGTLLREASDSRVHLIIGGAKLWIPSMDELDALGLSGTPVRVVPVGAMALVPEIPRDGTVVRERSASEIYVVSGGTKHWIPNAGALQRFGGPASVRVAPNGSLAQIPTGPQIPAEPGECVHIRAGLTERRDTIASLQEARLELDPRDPSDRAEIARIRARIAQLRQEIEALEAQRAALGCS